MGGSRDRWSELLQGIGWGFRIAVVLIGLFGLWLAIDNAVTGNWVAAVAAFIVFGTLEAFALMSIGIWHKAKRPRE